MANQNHHAAPPSHRRGERKELSEELLQVARRYARLPVPQPTAQETGALIDRLLEAVRQTRGRPPAPAPRRSRRVRHLLETLAACLLVGALIGGFVLSFVLRGPHQPAQQVSSQAPGMLVSLSMPTKAFPGPPTIVAQRASDGKHLWSRVIGQQTVFAVFPTLTVQDGVVYVKGGQQVYALNASDGNLLWHLSLPWPSSPGSPPPSFGHDAGTLVADHGMLLTQLLDDTSETAILFALRARDGQVLWQYPTGVEHLFTVAGGTIYVSARLPDTPSRLLALQETTGRLLWSYPASIASTAQQDGRVYAVSVVWPHLAGGTPQQAQPEGTLLALSVQHGTLLWSSKIAVTFGAIEDVGQVLVEHDRLLFFNGSQLGAYRSSDGQKLWEAAVSGRFALANQTVYALAGPQSARLEALDSTTGTLRWSTTVPVSTDTQLSLIAILQNSIYLLASPEGGAASLYALSLADGQQRWSSSYPFAVQATAAGS